MQWTLLNKKHKHLYYGNHVFPFLNKDTCIRFQRKYFTDQKVITWPLNVCALCYHAIDLRFRSLVTVKLNQNIKKSIKRRLKIK